MFTSEWIKYASQSLDFTGTWGSQVPNIAINYNCILFFSKYFT